MSSAGAAPLPAGLPLPANLTRLLTAYSALDALVCFLVKQRLSCSLQAVLSIANGAVTEDDVRALLAVAPAGLVSVRPTPVATHCATFDGAGNWRAGAGGPLARPLMHVAAPLPDLPDIDLDEDDASKPFTATGPGASGSAPAAPPPLGPAAGGAAGQLIVTLQPPGVGKQAVSARRSAMLQALLRRVAAAHDAHRATAAPGAARGSLPTSVSAAVEPPPQAAPAL